MSMHEGDSVQYARLLIGKDHVQNFWKKKGSFFSTKLLK